MSAWWLHPGATATHTDEALFLQRHGIDPYEAGRYGVLHEPPIVLAILSATQPYVPTTALALILGAVTAFVLRKTCERVHAHLPQCGIHPGDIILTPTIVALIYFLHPFNLVASLSHATFHLNALFILLGLNSALTGRTALAAANIAVASYLSFYPCVLIVPLLLFARNNIMSCVIVLVAFLTSASALLGASYTLTGGSWTFVDATYGFLLGVPDQTPNVGLFWYFFIEVFDVFRGFFLQVFQLHVFIYALPLAIKFFDQPILVFTALLGVITIFKPYTTIEDSALFLAVVAMLPYLFRYMRYSFIVANMLLFAVILGSTFFHLWTIEGSGNANFFYAVTLVYGFAHILLLIDVLFAHQRYVYDTKNPDQLGKKVVMKN